MSRSFLSLTPVPWFCCAQFRRSIWQASQRNLRKKEASEIAERIFDLYVDLHDLVRRSDR